jgi:hypothetical protein
LSLALLLAGCTPSSPGGHTRPGGYRCAGTANPAGCYTGLTLSHRHLNSDRNADIPDDPLGFSTNLLLVPLSCGLTCQASSGNPRYPGFIANILQLYDSHSRQAIRVGYETTPDGVNTVFDQYSVPGATPPWVTDTVLPTGVNPDFGGSIYPFVTLGIEWDGTAWIMEVSGLQYLGRPYRYGNPVYFVTPAFHPDTVQLLQEVYGSADAAAPGAVFTNNQVKLLGLGWRPLQEDGTVTIPELTPTHPTLAGWLIEPGASANGGSFFVSCC